MLTSGKKTGLSPKSVWKKLGDEGLLCTAVAKKYGGPGKDFLYSVIVAEEMVRTGQSGLVSGKILVAPRAAERPFQMPLNVVEGRPKVFGGKMLELSHPRC